MELVSAKQSKCIVLALEPRPRPGQWTIKYRMEQCFITYILAASSANYSITKAVYDQGWARNGAIKTANSSMASPYHLAKTMAVRCFEHYSPGAEPTNLPTIMLYIKIRQNPRAYQLQLLQSQSQTMVMATAIRWGLTASNIRNGYTASSPTNDQGFIALPPPCLLCLLHPMNQWLRWNFYYYVLGDKIFKEYGFADAFSLDVLRNRSMVWWCFWQ